jgi:hypothetical protein
MVSPYFKFCKNKNRGGRKEARRNKYGVPLFPGEISMVSPYFPLFLQRRNKYGVPLFPPISFRTW